MSEESSDDLLNSGHGHVFPRPDGTRFRCGGPATCHSCLRDLAVKEAQQSFALGKPDARPFPPLKESHPLVDEGEACAACFATFEAGDITTLVFLGPGADPVERLKARAGRPFSGVGVPVHWACHTGSDDPAGDFEASE